jgi:hypothetical protein
MHPPDPECPLTLGSGSYSALSIIIECNDWNHSNLIDALILSTQLKMMNWYASFISPLSPTFLRNAEYCVNWSVTRASLWLCLSLAFENLSASYSLLLSDAFDVRSRWQCVHLLSRSLSLPMLPLCPSIFSGLASHPVFLRNVKRSALPLLLMGVLMAASLWN